MSYREDKIKKMLPRTYVRSHVAHEVALTLTYFKHLVPVMEHYVYNDGITKELMSLTGTIPVLIKDQKYNIPVCLWLEESYPQTAPICYVRPTKEMMVLRGEYISTSGEVTLSYLKEWKAGEYDLMSLLQVMIAVFGESPPLAMRPPPEPEHGSCWLEYQREAQVLTEADGSMYVHIDREDGQPFQQCNETHC